MVAKMRDKLSGSNMMRVELRPHQVCFFLLLSLSSENI